VPFRVEVIQTDNGAEFQSAFHWHVLDRGVQHVYIKPATPRLNGKVERSHRIDADEFYRLLDGVVLNDARLFTTKLQEWEDFCNFDRPHGALGGQTPHERLRQKAGARVKRPSSVAQLGPAGPGIMRGERCLKIAAVIDPTDADTWPTLELEWLKAKDEFWRAGFVEGALELHEGHDG
jgi:hypothetical protein